MKRAAATYNVPKSTLCDRLARKAAQRDCEPNLKNLTKLKEEVVIRHILDLNLRRFPPCVNAVKDIANTLLTARSARVVG